MPNVMSRRRFLKIAAGGILGAGVPAIGGSAYVTRIEPYLVQTTRIDIPLRHLSPAFDGFTLAQISDIHLGEWMNRDRLLPIIQQVNALNADAVVITGDFVSVMNPVVTDDLTYCLRQLRSTANFAILGNHDHWNHAPFVRETLADAGNVRLLTNEHVALSRQGEKLYLAGVDDIWEKQHDLTQALNGIPTDAPIILLAHEPDYADEVTLTQRVGLMLSGHTHGGQVRLPGKGALVLPYLGTKYQAGLYELDGMALYVNRGVGMVPPLVRFDCPPEITLITLRTA